MAMSSRSNSPSTHVSDMSEEGGGGGSQSLQQSRASCFAELTELYTVDYLKLRQDSDIIHLYLQEFRIRYVSAVVTACRVCACV